MNYFDEQSLIKNLIMTSEKLKHYATKNFFEPMGLSATYCEILILLSKMGPMTPTRMVMATGSSKSNISQRLDVLEKKGLIERSDPKNPKDKRQISIILTKTGKEKFDQIGRTLQKKTLFLENELSEAEKAGFKSCLDKINLMLESHDSECHNCYAAK